MENESTSRCHLLGVLPLGLFSLSVFFDMHTMASGDGQGALIAFWLIAIGVTVGMTATPFSVANWRRIPQGAFAKDLGLWHCVLNVLVLALFAGSLFLRFRMPTAPSWMALLLSFLAVPLALFTGWLAGEFSDRMTAWKMAVGQWHG